MTLNELKVEIQKHIDKGYGEKKILINSDTSETLGDDEIDSIQKNTHPEVEPEYLIIMQK